MEKSFRISVYIVVVISWIMLGIVIEGFWTGYHPIHAVLSFGLGWFLDDIVKYFMGDTGKKNLQ